MAQDYVMVIFDKSIKGSDLLGQLKMDSSNLGKAFQTDAIKHWESSEIPFLLRWFAIGKGVGQSIMAHNMNMLMNEAFPLAIRNKNIHDIQLIIASSDSNTKEISDRIALMSFDVMPD